MTSWRVLPAVLAIVSLTACSGPYSNPTVAAKQDESLPIRAQRAEWSTVPETVTATGELFADDMVTLRAKVPGRVESLYVDLGSAVQTGQPVAELEKADYEFRVRQAEAMVEQTRARLGLARNAGDGVDPAGTALVRQAAASLREARLMHINATRLFEEGVISKVDFERAGVALQAAEARHQGAIEEIFRIEAELLERRAALDLARQQLADTVIRAPFAGAVTRRETAIGEYLPVNSPIAQVVRDDPMRIRLTVPERFAGRLRRGQAIALRLESAPVRHTGRVVRMSPALEADQRALLVEGEIPNRDGSLRAGSFVEAEITVDPNARSIVVPATAVRSFAGIHRMFVIEQDALADRVVRIGRDLGDKRTEIVEGIEPGDLFVPNPDGRHTEGLRVTVE
ncbi:MAG: efflux RND transporter periplasmic adaptor subunit [Bryobacterales bacterium]|nr:efflux RND transporter periplasmic adaptor subunit [Bryobacterales bacterium]